MANWDERFLRLALHISEWSKDPTTKVGCVIVGPSNEVRSIGFNGFPRGVNDDDSSRYDRPAKYMWTEHAERNAIYNAARIGVALENCRMYLPWFPCGDCARAIIQAGIVELIAVEPQLDHPKWGDDFRAAKVLLEEGGVKVRFVVLPDGMHSTIAAKSV
ncbi:MAG: dCMP deaminase family protein [Terriglobales bacterium]